MKAVQVVNSGNDYSLILDEVDTPKCGEHDVIIKIHAAGLNRADIFQAQGNYPPPEGASEILGLEAAGEIVEMGAEVKNFSLGDKVFGLLSGGGYAEYASVACWRILPIPSDMDMINAAGVAEAVYTVHRTLFDLAKLKPTESVLIHGGASGIGTMAIQMAKAIGVAQIYATAGTDEKCKLCEDLGAKQAINYKKEDFVEIIKEVDVVLDMVGGSYFQKNMKILKLYGRLISISFLEGAKTEVNFAPLLLKNLKLIGSTLRSRSEEEIHDLTQSIRTTILPLIESGQIKPVIDSVFPLEEARKAHEKMQNFKHSGKIILSVARN